jgi:hypothetical protein
MGVSRPRSLQGRLWVIAILLGLLALIAQPAPGGAPYKGGTDAGASGHVSFTRTEFAATDVASRTHSPHGEAVVAVEVVVPVVPAKYDGSAIPSRHSSASATASAAMSLQFSETTGSSMPPVPLASETDATDAAAGATRPFVIGEDTARVNAAARAFDAETYPGYANPDGLAEGSPELDQARLSDNSQWIRDRIAAGQRGIDIGPAPGRANFPGATSDAYSVELYELETAGYGNVVQPYDLPIPLEVP